MSTRASLRPRPKRNVKVKLPLTEQDLQDYLDDGYTPARIAKEYGVSLTVITAKIQKLRPKGRSKPRKVAKKTVKKTARLVPPKKLKQRGRPTNRRSSPRNRKDGKEVQKQTSKQDLNSVITQVINDNPKEVDNIHALLGFMGFSVEKSFVEDHLQRWKAASGTSPKKGRKRTKVDDVTGKDVKDSQKMEQTTPKIEHDTNKATSSEVDDVLTTQQTEDNIPGKSVSGETSLADDDKVTDTCQEDGVTSGGKEGSHIDGSVGKGEPTKQTQVKKRGRGRPRKTCSIKPLEEDGSSQCPKCRKRTKTEEKDGDTTTGDTDENNTMEEEDAGDNVRSKARQNIKKRRRKNVEKPKTEATEDQPGSLKGRPRLTLTKENLQLCIDSGLTTARIAEVFGAGVQSVKRYLRMHKMRKKDRFSKISDEELDQMVLEMCKAHPEWGQVHIQEELKKKGFFLCRAQVRSSVRRVDPVGIEVRRLKNLKMRWNRGSMNKLDKILPADGINMTSTESFISKPPRNGLNALSDEESVRILTSVVASSKKTYVESMSRDKLERSKKSEDEVDNKDEEKEIESELVAAVQKVENADEEKREETGNKENIGTDTNRQPDCRTSSPNIGEKEEEEDYRKRFYNMVMSYEKCRKEPVPDSNESSVNIPKEELQECVNLGFSTARMAEKFGTSRSNVIRHLNIHKLGKPRRFENISDETLDQIVTDVIKEFSIRKGSEVYSYAKKKGFQIRRKDINKSLSRLFPKGLHRKSSSILQESWDAASKLLQQGMEYATTQAQQQGDQTLIDGETVAIAPPFSHDEGQTFETQDCGQTIVMECDTSHAQVHTVQTASGGETVVVLNSEELAQLIHGDGNIVIQYEESAQAAEHVVGEFSGNQTGQVNNVQQPSLEVFAVANDSQGVEQQ